MIHYSFRAMGTWVEAWCGVPADAERLEEWFEDVEATCSRFRPDSELSHLNASPVSRIPLSPIMREVIQVAERARESTGGIVDVGLGAMVSAWGYDRTFDEVRDLAESPLGLEAPDWELEGDALVKVPGTKLDLGGVCKGWTCDRAVETGLAKVVSAGGDIRSAHPETVVPVIDPWGNEAAVVRLGVGALATSSTSRRRWRVAGREASHLIDPRTLSPVQSPVLSAAILADTAAQAEAGAKAVLVMGEDGLAWAAETDWIRSALVVWHDGSVFATKGLELAA